MWSSWLQKFRFLIHCRYKSLYWNITPRRANYFKCFVKYNIKHHLFVHQSPQLDPITSQMSPVGSLKSHFIHIPSSAVLLPKRIRLNRPRHFRFPYDNSLRIFHIFLINVLCFVLFLLFGLITVIIIDKFLFLLLLPPSWVKYIPLTPKIFKQNQSVLFLYKDRPSLKLIQKKHIPITSFYIFHFCICKQEKEKGSWMVVRIFRLI